MNSLIRNILLKINAIETQLEINNIKNSEIDYHLNEIKDGIKYQLEREAREYQSLLDEIQGNKDLITYLKNKTNK